MQSSMLKAIVEDFGNGGTIDGDLVISGDLTVSGGGSLSFDEILEGTQVIDVTSTEALLVRKNADGGNVFVVDTTNSRVGIGASSPGKTLDIAGDMRMTGVYTNTRGTEDAFIAGSGDAFYIEYGTSSKFQIREGSDVRMVVADGGNVGIGATAPAEILHLKPSSGDVAIRFEDTGVLAYEIGLDDGTSNFVMGQSIASPHITIVGGSGKVGIGTASPDTNLHIYENVGSETEIKVENIHASGSAIFKAVSHTGRWAQIQFGDTADEDRARVAYDNNNDKMLFKVNGSADVSLAIDSSGSVGIGTDSPSSKLHVKEIAGDEFFTFANGDGIGLTNNVASHGIGMSASQSGSYGSSGSVALKLKEGGGSANAGTLQLFHDGAVGFTYKGGNVGIGTASPTATLQIGDSTVVATNRLVFGKAQAATQSYLPAIGQQSSTGAGNDLALSATGSSAVIRFYTGNATSSGAIGTGSNTERMRIDSSGDVNIGTNDTAQHILSIGHITLDNAVGAGLSFVTATDGNVFMDTKFVDAADTLQFRYGTAAQYGYNSTWMTMKAGNVGIGTTSPSSFDSEANNLVVGSGVGDNGITIFTGSSAGHHGSIFFGDGTGTPKQGQIRYEQNNEVMSFFTNTAERMRIDATGNVGIGTTSPTQLLTIDTNISSSSKTFLEVLQSTTGAEKPIAAMGISVNNGGEATNAGDLWFKTASGGSLAERMRIDSSGNVLVNSGVGLQFGDANTKITGSSASNLLSFYANGAINFKLDANSRISLSNNDTGTGNTIFGKTAGDPDGAGDLNVYIGELSGGSSIQTNACDNNVGVGYQSLTAITSGNNNIGIGQTAGDVITSGTQNTIVGASSDPSSNSGTNQSTLGYGVTGVADNSVTLGNASVTDVYMASDSGAVVHCAGVEFPATFSNDTNANTLDDYEEGTWTPVYYNITDGANVTATYDDTLAGFYTKIGRLVTLSCYIRTDALTAPDATDVIGIGGIPFTVSAGTDGHAQFPTHRYLVTADLWDDVPQVISVGEDEAFARLYTNTTAGNEGTAANQTLGNDFTAGTTANRNQLAFSITYQI